jgi:uroporphyrinogen-III decarboxylase
VDEFISVVPAGELFRNGELDHREAANKAFGGNRFILALGPPSTLGMCDVMFGQTNTLVMLREEPELVDYVAERSLQRTIQQIRRAAEVGADGMYFYDHMSTGDLISPADYDRFCRPVIARMVYEAHSLGMKTLVCCYGNVMDRLDLIASTGADALQVECAMKGYANDIDAIAERIGDRMTLFSNIDPIWCLEKATEEELTSEIRRQIAAGRKSRGFILGPASPITPATPLRRVQRFIELCHDLGTQRQRPNVPSGP